MREHSAIFVSDADLRVFDRRSVFWIVGDHENSTVFLLDGTELPAPGVGFLAVNRMFDGPWFEG